MIYDYLQTSGGQLMWPIILASIVAMTIVLDRFIYWIQTWSSHSSWQRKKLLKCPPSPDDPSPSSDPLALVLWEYHRQGLENAQLLAREKISESRRYLPTLRLLGNISTSVGLLGTVVGVAMSFQSMALTDSAGVAKGLSTALYTTIGGLVVFLFASLFLHFFQTLSDKLKKKMEEALTHLHYGKKDGPGPSNSERVYEKEDFIEEGEKTESEPEKTSDSKEEERVKEEEGQSLFSPLLGGGLVAFTLGILWGGVVMFTGYEMGFLASLMGLLSGMAVVFFARDLAILPLQFIAVAVSFMGILVGKYLSFYYFYKISVGKHQGAEMALQLSLFSQAVMADFFQKLSVVFGPLDIIWICLALIIAWILPHGYGVFMEFANEEL